MPIVGLVKPVSGGHVALWYTHRGDYDAVSPEMGKFLTSPMSAQRLSDSNKTECSNAHKHTCGISLVDNETYGDVIVIVSVSLSPFSPF